MEMTTIVRLRSNTGATILNEKTGKTENVRTTAMITFNWEGITQEELDRLATDQVKILTSHYYKKLGIIPEGDLALDVRKVMPGGPRATRKPVTIESFSREELLAQLERLGKM